jgi:hypothetical protein
MAEIITSRYAVGNAGALRELDDGVPDAPVDHPRVITVTQYSQFKLVRQCKSRSYIEPGTGLRLQVAS